MAEKQDPAAVALEAFLDRVAGSGLELYPAQEAAVLELLEGRHVILATPTGSGKSLVAEGFLELCRARGRRAVYTFPIKALVQEKFFSLVDRFGAEAVGLATGDATVNADAPILCCTAEVLAQLALAGGEETPFGGVIMDEFHYYGDRDRGMAWQVPLLCLRRAQFLLMSATLPDTRFFEADLEGRTGVPVVTVRSEERPVPLAFRWAEVPLPELLARLAEEGWLPAYIVHFRQRAAAETAQALASLALTTREEREVLAAELAREEFPSPYGRELRQLLRHGIGVHHAGLLPRYRLLVERLAQRGLLKAICGTDTLGVGINVPIRTVVFTALTKFDGRKVGHLAVRDFRQIAGRAGRRGFDNEGLVVALAPEHIIENRRLEKRAGADPAKRRKMVRKSPPPGFVGWGAETFERLQKAPPENLSSSFRVTHGLLLPVLGRDGDGCRALRELIAESHELPGAKVEHRRRAWQLLRTLRDRGLVRLRGRGEDAQVPKVALADDLPRDFSLHHGLSLYFLDLVGTLDPADEGHALRVVSCAEAIVEDPGPILQAQAHREKGRKLEEWKAEGLSYEERMEKLETITWPQPEREFLEETYAIFAAAHPWVAENDRPMPKSVVREMAERFMGFADYIKEYGLQRQEGLLLRHLGQVWKVLDQTVPEGAYNDELAELTAWLETEVRGTDTSLLAEWERLAGLAGAEPAAAVSGPALPPRRQRIWRADDAEFRRLVRAAVHAWLRGFATGTDTAADETDGIRLRDVREAYVAAKGGPPRLDPAARAAACTRFEVADDGRQLRVEQILVDAAEDNDWIAAFTVDPTASQEAGRVILELEAVAAAE